MPMEVDHVGDHRSKVLESQEAGAGDDVRMEDPILNTVEETTEVVVRPPPVIHELSSDSSDEEELNRPHESDNNDQDHDGQPKVKEMKPLLALDGTVVKARDGKVIKIEKGYWKE